MVGHGGSPQIAGIDSAMIGRGETMELLFAIAIVIASSVAQAKDSNIEKMITTYDANQARFHAQYRDKELSGTATVTGIKADPFGTGSSFYIYLDVNGSRVACDTNDRNVAASLDKGQQVQFKGRVHDVVLGALDVQACTFSASRPSRLGPADGIRTRFGVAEIDDEKAFLFKGKKLTPSIEGNSGLSAAATHQIGNTDVLILQDTGGTACPALFYAVTISATGARGSPGFGTCSDLVKIVKTGDVISLTMPGYMGPFEPEAERVKAAKTTRVFLYKDGVVSEKGIPVK